VLGGMRRRVAGRRECGKDQGWGGRKPGRKNPLQGRIVKKGRREAGRWRYWDGAS